MIDINELRRLALDGDLAAMQEIIYRLKAAEKDRDVLRDRLALESQENGALRDSVDRACEERDELRTELKEVQHGVAVAHDTIKALRARIEAAEKEVVHIKEVEFPRKARAVAVGWDTKCVRLEQERTIDEQRIADLMAELNRVGHENDELRAKIEAMERQEPVAWLHESRRDSDVVTSAVKHVWGKAAVGSMAAYSIPLYALPGAKGEEK